MTQGPEAVVLLHGILRSAVDMWPLSVYLRRRGYHAVNILYPARHQNLKDLAAFLHERLSREPGLQNAARVHFVTHSMGGLLARYYIAAHRPARLGAVVMLSPPSTGSDMADALLDRPALRPLYKRIFGPAAEQLATTYAHPQAACDIDYPLGIIAGSRSINPLAGVLLRGRGIGAHDGIVPVARTHIKGESDHITLPVSHSLMMFAPAVMRQTLNFLKEGKFLRAES